MAIDAPQTQADLIDAVSAMARERLPAEQVESCEAFIRQYFHWVPEEDLAERDPGDLGDAVLRHWSLVQRRQANETKLALLTPDESGKRSHPTLLEIVTDDMPFLVDSVVMELSRSGYGTHLVIHPVIRVQRDANGVLMAIAEPGQQRLPDDQAESVIHVELDREPDPERLQLLREGLQSVLDQVRAAVEDWEPMCDKALALAAELGRASAQITDHERTEAQEFLRWLTDDHFVFLGYRQYDIVREPGASRLERVAGSGLGILRDGSPSRSKPLGERALALALEQAPLLLTNANSKATVHRPAYLDYVGVRRFGPDGEVIGESRFLGLYSTAAYRESAVQIPLVRDKIRYVLEQAGFPPDSHDAKALTAICEDYPRDALIQVSPEDLLQAATGILALGERQRVRLFVRRDPLDRFVACLVCVPRERVTTETRNLITEILLEAFDGTHFDWSLERTESTIARLSFLIHCRDGVPDYDEPALERRLKLAVRAWEDDLRDALLADHGEVEGLALHRRYQRAFPPAYQSDWDVVTAVQDVERLERLRDQPGPIVSLYRSARTPERPLRCKLFTREPVSLSYVLPKFELMGAPVADEHPYEVRATDGTATWIYDFGLDCEVENLETVHELFEHAFLGVWRGDFEQDRLGSLVLGAGMTAERIVILRALARYLHQVGGGLSDRYVEDALVGYPQIASMLVDLFVARHDPDDRDDEAAQRLQDEIVGAIDAVQSLEQDRILRTLLAVTGAILRTNYFMVPARPYVSFKLDPAQVGVLPLPLPRYEIWVYSPRVEGIHLRGGEVARGGLRWSDRRSDFRTEILGLMKAQMVKNALIVPVGSKGGFVVKNQPDPGLPTSREALRAEAVECYKMFLCGLLDLTDNIVGGVVVPPARVVRHDGDDPYLVVAADKGTATFSDIANEVSAEYGFWLGDAFASGGSQGYDHKAMGITARGAWESVKRHFRELGTDIQTTPFTVIGIGDMAGDVFGNGMLLSSQTHLLAAFNHMHVFIDPDPDPAVSFAERRRLFELPGSAWTDYDRSLISVGGGVYSRGAKSIAISAQARAALAIEESELTPDELISRILAAPVDLLWNGGIGTYVKSSEETNLAVGDKANDALRVNGRDLRCRVVGEGGNLGLTQLGRIEYALAGGRVNTDAIDNVGGVNTSDHEVNIKILLDAVVAAGEMSVDQRNQLLAQMTDAVAAQVLLGSYTQTEALSIAGHHALAQSEVDARLIRFLEQTAGLNLEVEFLPTEQELTERRAAGHGLTTPELAIVMAYCKIHFKAQLLDSDLPEDPYLGHDLERYFPAPLAQRHLTQMHEHRLRREIIATVVANQLVDRAGTTFALRLSEETGASAAVLARGYAVAREVYGMLSFWEAVEALDNKVQARVQLAMLSDARQLLEHATRWLIRTHGDDPTIDIAALVSRYAPGVQLMSAGLEELLGPNDRVVLEQRAAALTEAAVPPELALRAAEQPFLLPVFDIVEVAAQTGQELEVVIGASFRVEAALREMRSIVPSSIAASD